MTTPAQKVNTLIQDIVSDRKIYIELIGQLEKQRAYIIARNADDLSTLNHELVENHQRLTESAQKRHDILQSLGVAGGRKGITDLFARLPEQHQPKVNALWADLEQQARRCKEINERNGVMLHMQQDIVNNLINVAQPEAYLYQEG